jgi:hypothetical protein
MIDMPAVTPSRLKVSEWPFGTRAHSGAIKHPSSQVNREFSPSAAKVGQILRRSLHQNCRHYADRLRVDR